MWCMEDNCCAGGNNPALELIVVSNVAMNPLAFINDPNVTSLHDPDASHAF